MDSATEFYDLYEIKEMNENARDININIFSLVFRELLSFRNRNE